MKKAAAKKKPVPAAKKPAVKGPAKVLQHPSSPSKAASPSPQKPAFAPKRVPQPWQSFMGLTTVDFEDLVEQRQTLYRKVADLTLRLKGRESKKAKDYEETRAASLDGRIKKLLDDAGVHDNALLVGPYVVTTYTGHAPEYINKEKLLIALMDHLEPEVIEEVIESSTEGGDPYTALRITESKG